MQLNIDIFFDNIILQKTIKKYSKDIRAIKKIKSIDEFDKDFLKIIGF